MIEILDACDDFLVVHKPCGIGMHNERKPEATTLGIISLLREQCGTEDLYPVHRLDKVTSGVLLVAKNPSANRELSQQFESRQTQKYYLALSSSKPAKKQGAIVGDMQPSRRGAWKLVRSRDNPAVTHFFSHSIAPGLRGFIVKPTTGKTHQIRVALKSVGAPIVGDTRYGGADADRTYLHAWQLEFQWQGERRVYRAQPEDGALFVNDAFTLWASEVGNPAELNWPVK